ncbi:MAG: hypothetical protein GXP27_07440, partial [Planctomycetes bacterium]|nr:hypothetical protein [Planctomycetota bacterium]
TGFFRTEQIDGRWWVIDPKGRAFYIIGTDHVRYQGHWCQKLGYAPYGRNVQKKYGSEEKWAEATARRLAEWGFNTLTAGHSPSLRHRRFAHIEFLTFGSSFAAIDNLCPKTTWTGFPNVFSPKWPRHCDKLARNRCQPTKNDPWLIGYFLDNELEWFGKNHRPWGLFDEAWKKPAEHTAKQAWVAFLKAELESVAEFERHWGVRVADWSVLAEHTKPAPPRTERAQAIARDWIRLVAERYFRACREAIRRHDPNHLILGCRFAGSAPDIWDIAGRHCDIVSFNSYPRIDVDAGVPSAFIEQLRQWHRQAGKPLMITEWSFPALDSGLPCKHGAGMRVDTQQQRARCFTHFQTVMFSLPFMVGSDFFMWVDEPALGISETFPEDTNYGLVNERDEPYPELTEAARRLNPRVYELHRTGRLPKWPPPRLTRWLTQLPVRSPASLPHPLKLTTGPLRLEGPVGGHAWRLWYKKTLLGDLFPLMHQQVPQDRWIEPDTARVVDVRQNDSVTVVEMEFTKRAGPAGQPVPHRGYRARFRFWIPRDSAGWIASQCLWVENTDRRPWRRRGFSLPDSVNRRLAGWRRAAATGRAQLLPPRRSLDRPLGPPGRRLLVSCRQRIPMLLLGQPARQLSRRPAPSGRPTFAARTSLRSTLCPIGVLFRPARPDPFRLVAGCPATQVGSSGHSLSLAASILRPAQAQQRAVAQGDEQTAAGRD